MPAGIPGFLQALPVERLLAVRVADSNGEHELHMQPGEGIIDFPDMFRRVEATGFQGHYMCAFGSLDAMLRGRTWLAERFPAWAEPGLRQTRAVNPGNGHSAACGHLFQQSSESCE